MVKLIKICPVIPRDQSVFILSSFSIGKNLACDVAKLGEFKEVRKVTGLDDVLTDTELG